MDKIEKQEELEKKKQKQEERKEKQIEKEEEKNELKNVIDELHKSLIKKMREFSIDNKEYMRYLDVLTKNDYSLNNNLYIDHQIQERNKLRNNNELEGKYMTTYKGWKELGYNVEKGEQAIKLIMPRTVEYFIDENEKFKPLKYANEEQKEKIKNGNLESGAFTTYYSKGAIFDIKQTNCPSEDVEKVIKELTPKTLKATNDEKLDNLIKDFKTNLESEGFKIREEDLGDTKGYINRNKEIVLNTYNTNTQNFKTLLHEYAHYKSEHFNREDLSKETKEIEAESIAYLVAKNHGIDTSDYSFKYLNSYGKENINQDLIKSQEVIRNVSKEINSKLNDLYNLRQQKINIDKDMEDKISRLNVKIIKSDNANIIEGKLMDFKSANELYKNNIGNGNENIKFGVLCENEQKVLNFSAKLDGEKTDLYQYINNSKALADNLKNEISAQEKAIPQVKTTEVTKEVNTSVKTSFSPSM